MRFLSGKAEKGELRIYYLGRNKTTKHDLTQLVSKFLCRQLALTSNRCELWNEVCQPLKLVINLEL